MTARYRHSRRPVVWILTTLLLVVMAMPVHGLGTVSDARRTAGTASFGDVVPAPVEAHQRGGKFRITRHTRIHALGDSTGVAGVTRYLASVLRPSTGYPLPVVEWQKRRSPRALARSGGASRYRDIFLLQGASGKLGHEGYRLEVTRGSVILRANQPSGLFRGVQTLRQLLPALVESRYVQPGPWTIPAGEIVDYPRFAYRGAMLDVARHFFSVEEVKRYIDELVLYKVNYFHLHLTDDQGWRIEIDSWPRLATYGGSTEVGGGPGGYYTKEEYREIVEYARDRYMTVVPEIDMPGHTNAALASYAELNCDGQAPPLYTGTEVGFSSLCVDKEVTYEFVDDVIREVAEMTPGPYIHIGGDEARTLSEEQYATFMQRAQRSVQSHGNTVMVWHQAILNARPLQPMVGQYWGTTPEAPEVAAAAERGIGLVLSPASHAFLDIKYNADTELGLDWPGFTSVRDAYEWDPVYINGVSRSSVLGVEAPLWSETLNSIDDVEYMAFPRLPAVAELGWSRAEAHDWGDFRRRLAAQGPRWAVMGIDFYRSSQVPWPEPR